LSISHVWFEHAPQIVQYQRVKPGRLYFDVTEGNALGISRYAASRCLEGSTMRKRRYCLPGSGGEVVSISRPRALPPVTQ
jgi:hypothetical protein